MTSAFFTLNSKIENKKIPDFQTIHRQPQTQASTSLKPCNQSISKMYFRFALIVMQNKNIIYYGSKQSKIRRA